MQEKVNSLIEIVSNIKNQRAKNKALNIITELVDIINNQEADILSLSAWKTNNKQHDIECELEKYVLILILYGYSQQFIKIIRKETIEFATRNKIHFKQLKPEDLKNLDHWLMVFELENGRKPKDINEFKEFYNEAKS